MTTEFRFNSNTNITNTNTNMEGTAMNSTNVNVNTARDYIGTQLLDLVIADIADRIDIGKVAERLLEEHDLESIAQAVFANCDLDIDDQLEERMDRAVEEITDNLEEQVDLDQITENVAEQMTHDPDFHRHLMDELETDDIIDAIADRFDVDDICRGIDIEALAFRINNETIENLTRRVVNLEIKLEQMAIVLTSRS